jgi:uncharacterized protein YkwD
VILHFIRRAGFGLAALACATLMASPVAASTALPEFARQAFDLINAERIRLGLPALLNIPAAALEAELHCRDMADRAYFSHYTLASASDIVPDPAGSPGIRFTGGMTPGDRLVACGFTEAFWGWGENIAYSWGYGAQSPQIAVNGWLGSPGHYANLTHTSFRGTGVGCAQAADGRVYFCQVFTVSTAGAQPITSSPPPGGTTTPPSGTTTPPPAPSDTTAPGSWTGFGPTYTDSYTPTCYVQVKDDGGLDVATAQYRFSRDGGYSWSDWAGATCSGSTGSIGYETITAMEVPFYQLSWWNRIQLRIRDRAGNLGTSPAYNLRSYWRGW